MITCPRCNTPNPPHMRFCNNCGFQLGALQGGQPAAPQQGALQQAPASVQQAAPIARPQYAPQPASAYGAQPAPVCWRCRSLGESGADFCKFCGARYADAQAASSGAASSGAAQPGGAGFGGAQPASSVASAIGGYAPAPQPMQPQPMQPQPMQPQPMQQAAPQAPPATSPFEGGAPARASHGTLVAILKDGSDGRAYPIVDDPTDVGRTEGHIILGDDPYLSPRHARLVPRADGLLVRDLDSINGVYVRLREPVELNDGDTLLLGQQLVRFEILPETELPLGPAMHRGVLVFGTPEVARLARLVQYTTEGVGRDVHYLYRDETVVGREQGDVVCTDDPFMSRRHAAIALDRSARRFVLRDLGSSNGTAIRVRGERLLKQGDQFRVGRHLFRYDRPGASA